MKAIESLDFGLIIAYVIPGFVTLYTISLYSEPVRSLLGGNTYVPQAGAIIPLIFLAIAVGIAVNALAWATLRHVIQATGVPRPDLNYALLTKEKSVAFQEIIQSDFRYYQYYTNTLTAFLLLCMGYVLRSVANRVEVLWLVATVLIVVLFFASRDSLQRSYSAIGALLTPANAHDQEKKGGAE
jgi:hypothetical protein